MACKPDSDYPGVCCVCCVGGGVKALAKALGLLAVRS